MSSNTGWVGGPLFYKAKQCGSGTTHSGGMGKRRQRFLPNLMRALAAAAKVAAAKAETAKAMTAMRRA